VHAVVHHCVRLSEHELRSITGVYARVNHALEVANQLVMLYTLQSAIKSTLIVTYAVSCNYSSEWTRVGSIFDARHSQRGRKMASSWQLQFVGTRMHPHHQMRRWGSSLFAVAIRKRVGTC
jgi:hypothetical protein